MTKFRFSIKSIITLDNCTYCLNLVLIFFSFFYLFPSKAHANANKSKLCYLNNATLFGFMNKNQRLKKIMTPVLKSKLNHHVILQKDQLKNTTNNRTESVIKILGYTCKNPYNISKLVNAPNLDTSKKCDSGIHTEVAVMTKPQYDAVKKDLSFSKVNKKVLISSQHDQVLEILTDNEKSFKYKGSFENTLYSKQDEEGDNDIEE